MEVGQSQSDLTEIVDTLSSSSSFASRLHQTQQKREQHQYDGDYYKEFGKRESRMFLFSGNHATSVLVGSSICALHLPVDKLV